MTAYEVSDDKIHFSNGVYWRWDASRPYHQWLYIVNADGSAIGEWHVEGSSQGNVQSWKYDPQNTNLDSFAVLVPLNQTPVENYYGGGTVNYDPVYAENIGGLPSQTIGGKIYQEVTATDPHRNFYDDATGKWYWIHDVAGQTIPPIIPQPQPSTMFHELLIHYRDAWGIGDKFASMVTDIGNRIDGLLPQNFKFRKAWVDGNNNTIHVIIDENGNNVLPVAVIAAIVAAVIAVIGLLLFVSYEYIENGQLKANLTVQSGAVDKIRAVMQRTDLSDDEKRRLIDLILQQTPDVVVDNSKGGIDFSMIALVGGIVALALSRK